MNHKYINVNNKRISISGNNSNIEKAENIISILPLTGNEGTDRIIIQKAIDNNKLNASILYDGNTVYSFDKTVKEYRKLQKTGSLRDMTEYMYHFFTNACGDIAHYNIEGFRANYNYSLQNLEKHLLSRDNYTPSWHTDLDLIFKELKIGKYYSERNYINIDIVPVKKIKELIKNYGYEITVDNNTWNFVDSIKDYNVDVEEKGTTISFKPSVKSNHNFEFSLELPNNNATNVINSIYNYYKNFDKDKYIREKIVNSDKNGEKTDISKIVYNTDTFISKLSNLSDYLLYNCKNEAEIISHSLKSKELDCELDLDI